MKIVKSEHFNICPIILLKPGVGNPVITYAHPEPGRPDCIISMEIGVNGDAYPVAISQKVAKKLPVSFYSPMPGFKEQQPHPTGGFQGAK